MIGPNSDGGLDTALAPLASPPSSVANVVFLGTPDVAAVTLRALIESPISVSHVITKPDKRRGRGSKLTRSPVSEVAHEHGIPVSHDPADAPTVGADLGVVVAFGQLIRRPVLEQLAMINLHFSLLPRWRGAAPVERAILAGDTTTGVCVMEVAEGLDVGDVYARSELEIGSNETADELRERLSVVGSQLLIEQLAVGLSKPEPQAGEPVYAAKLDRSEFRLDMTDTAENIHRKIRIGRAWCEFRDRRLIITAARQVMDRSDDGEDNLASIGLGPGELAGPFIGTGQGTIELVTVKPEGKREMAAQDWLNGTKPTPDDRLS